MFMSVWVIGAVTSCGRGLGAPLPGLHPPRGEPS